MTDVASVTNRVRSLSFDVRSVVALALVLNAQLVFVVLYYALSGVTLADPRYVLYGLVWVNVGAAVLYTTRAPADTSFSTRRRALAIAAAYFGLLAVFGGLISTGLGEHATGFRVAWLAPGWGPALVYGGTHLTVVLMPAYLLGYAALAALVYVTILDAAGSAVAGLLGLFSCISCTWPILAAVGSAVLGGSGLLATTALDASYDLSTAVFLLTVLLLYWRPGVR